MPQEDQKLVVSGSQRDRKITAPAPVPDRHAVHEQRARAHGTDPEAPGGRRLVQPELRCEGHGRGFSEARLGGVPDPPGSGERVGKTGSRGQGDGREDEKRGGVGEKAARRLPRGGR